MYYLGQQTRMLSGESWEKEHKKVSLEKRNFEILNFAAPYSKEEKEQFSLPFS